MFWITQVIKSSWHGSILFKLICKWLIIEHIEHPSLFQIYTFYLCTSTSAFIYQLWNLTGDVCITSALMHWWYIIKGISHWTQEQCPLLCSLKFSFQSLRVADVYPTVLLHISEWPCNVGCIWLHVNNLNFKILNRCVGFLFLKVACTVKSLTSWSTL